MDSICVAKPHVVLVPYPAQGHITPMLKLAKLLHSKGFYITFVNTEYNHRRFIRSHGESFLEEITDFQFDTIPDGLPPSDVDVTQDILALCDSTSKNCLVPFRNLLTKLNHAIGVPPVTCIVSDGIMSFTLDAAEELGIPDVLFWTLSSCGFLAYFHYRDLIERGLVPLKDMADVTNGYLDTPVDFIPWMNKMRLKDFPSFIRTTDPNDVMINFVLRETSRSLRGTAVIINTFDELEREVLEAMAKILPQIYTIGPLASLVNKLPNPLVSLSSSLWKEDTTCIDWLDDREPGSVVYVNFGSITVMSNEQLVEFAWGLANSKCSFLWVIRPDLVRSEHAVLPQEFLNDVKDRSMLASWCNQEAVLAHSSIGGFLTHCGWNSTLESISVGMSMICWPFFADQQTNCRYVCQEWEIGMEIDSNVKRENVEGLIKELMEGEKGKEMRTRALELKESAKEATSSNGSSSMNFERLVKQVLLANYKTM